jgi:hypothetical protein
VEAQRLIDQRELDLEAIAPNENISHVTSLS